MSESEKKKSKSLTGDKIPSTSTKELERKAAQTLLEEPIKFGIKGFGFLGKLRIRQLNLYTLVSISKDALNVVSIPQENANTLRIMAYANNAKPICRMAAKAILFKAWKIRLFTPILSRILLQRLTPKDLHTLLVAIINNSNADFFFSCMDMTSKMRMMKVKTDTSETKASGEQSQD